MHYKRIKPRAKSKSTAALFGGSRAGEAPSHWNILFHSKPRRRKDKTGCHKILNGADPEGVVWELGNRKPHVYYW